MLPTISRRNWLPEIFDEFFGKGIETAFDDNFRNTIPSVNIKEGNDHYTIEFAAPGMSKKDFKIDLHNNVMTVSSDRKEEDKEEKDNYMRREFRYSSFSRSFTLPDSVDNDKIKAKHDNGILSIVVPKRPDAVEKGPKQIEIS
jgi:HSP20 family protein